MKRALFIFRRDLRLQDNLGLLSALKSADEVILSFIFTPEQVEENPYKGNCSLQFMIESLEDLDKQISKRNGKLYIFYGKPEEIVNECIEELHIDGVFVNHDYTPYSIKRDKKIEEVCKSHSVVFNQTHDLLLHSIEDTLKKDGKPYAVFTPFYTHSSKLDISLPEENNFNNYYSKQISFSKDSSIYQKILPNRKKQAPGGREACLEILKNIESHTKYSIERDIPALDKTTHLSPHLKFTTCSIREVYHSIGSNYDLIRSLYWRDFFTLICYHFPKVFDGAFKTEFLNLHWDNNKKLFDLWCEGKTGFPIVDAGMRELNQTGFMHNRVRMITASFLVKDLHISWQWGERYFAQRLIDYDPAVNNGNWQWVAGTGCDAAPYFRIFNPWLQAKKFDKDCIYIKKWVPELASVPNKIIHSWYLKVHHDLCKDYPSPIVDHKKEAAVTLKHYKS